MFIDIFCDGFFWQFPVLVASVVLPYVGVISSKSLVTFHANGQFFGIAFSCFKTKTIKRSQVWVLDLFGATGIQTIVLCDCFDKLFGRIQLLVWLKSWHYIQYPNPFRPFGRFGIMKQRDCGAQVGGGFLHQLASISASRRPKTAPWAKTNLRYMLQRKKLSFALRRPHSSTAAQGGLKVGGEEEGMETYYSARFTIHAIMWLCAAIWCDVCSWRFRNRGRAWDQDAENIEHLANDDTQIWNHKYWPWTRMSDISVNTCRRAIRWPRPTWWPQGYFVKSQVALSVLAIYGFRADLAAPSRALCRFGDLFERLGLNSQKLVGRDKTLIRRAQRMSFCSNVSIETNSNLLVGMVGMFKHFLDLHLSSPFCIVHIVRSRGETKDALRLRQFLESRGFRDIESLPQECWSWGRLEASRVGGEKDPSYFLPFSAQFNNLFVLFGKVTWAKRGLNVVVTEVFSKMFRTASSPFITTVDKRSQVYHVLKRGGKPLGTHQFHPISNQTKYWPESPKET